MQEKSGCRPKVSSSPLTIRGKTFYKLREGLHAEIAVSSDILKLVTGSLTIVILTAFSSVQFSSVQSLSRVRLFATLWTAAHQPPLSITNSQSLFKLMSIESVMPSNHLILCRPLLLPPSIFLSLRVFSNESVFRIRWPKNWSFSFSISPPNEYSGLISFRMDWLAFLAVQGTLKSFLQHHSLKASIPLYSTTLYIVKLYSFLYRPSLTSIHDYWKN